MAQRLGFGSGAVLAALCLAPVPLAGQMRLTLAQVNQRLPPDYSPVYQGRTVQIQGVVNTRALHFPEYGALALDDGTGGAVLTYPAPGDLLDRYRPGDEIRVTGLLTQRSGMAIVVPQHIELLGQKPVPAPISVPLRELQSFRYAGRLVRTEGHIKNMAETMSGPAITLDAQDQFWIFLPREQNRRGDEFGSFSKGDLVEATGIAAQYCPRPPYNRSFEVLAPGPESVLRKESALAAPALAVGAGFAAIAAVALILWARERRLRSHRERLRKIYQLGEEILGASSSEAIWKRIAETLPAILSITRVHLYVHNRGAKTLEGVAEQPGESVSIPLADPPAGAQSGIAACFYYRTLLMIPDIARSPFPVATPGRNTPRSLLFVPMMAQGEAIGVMELDQDDRMREFSAEEQSLAQHLGNQIGAALRLIAQRNVQEQLFRTEKLAAVGRLISGVVNDLQTPLRSISGLAGLALERDSLNSAERDLQAIAAEAQRASALVERLVSYAGAEQAEARLVSIGALLRNLVEFRERDSKARGIRIVETVSREPLMVLGSQGQLEQVFLTLLVHAEQALLESSRKTITIRSSVLGKRLLVEIGFSAPAEWSTPESSASIPNVTRSVVAGHGGEVRLIAKPAADPRFEIDLPLAAKESIAGGPASGAAERGRQWTALVIEPDENAQRQIISMLAERGFRVVPQNNADSGLELANRMRFDAVFCSVHAPGLNWVELSERMYSRVGGFVLLSEGYDAELSSNFEGESRFVLPKPVQEGDLERVLRGIESAPAPGKVVSIRNNVA